MRLDFNASERAAAVLRAFQKLEGLTDLEMSCCVDGIIHPKTLNRHLNDVPRFTQLQAESFAKFVAAALPCEERALIRYILEGGDPPSVVRELVTAEIFDLTETGLTAVTDKLDMAQANTRVYRELRSFPAPEMLTDEVRPKFFEWRRLVSGNGRNYQSDLLSQFAGRIRTRFMFRLGALPDRAYVFMPHDQLTKLVFDILPAADCSRSDIDALIESWIFDSLYNRNVHFGIYDSERAPKNLPDGLDAIRIYDQRYAVKRLVGRPGMLWFEERRAGDQPAFWINKGLHTISLVRDAVPYNIDNKSEVEEALKKFLSPRTWYQRSLDAKNYRKPSTN